LIYSGFLVKKKYPEIARKAVVILMQFSAMLTITNCEERENLNSNEDEVRVNLSYTCLLSSEIIMKHQRINMLLHV
jgi:predicted PP-loop superfamily ATPase